MYCTCISRENLETTNGDSGETAQVFAQRRNFGDKTFEHSWTSVSAGRIAFRKCDNTPDRRQSKTLILSTNADKKIVSNKVFGCYLSPNTVTSDFDPRSSVVKSVFYCHLSGVYQ